MMGALDILIRSNHKLQNDIVPVNLSGFINNPIPTLVYTDQTGGIKKQWFFLGFHSCAFLYLVRGTYQSSSCR